MKTNHTDRITRQTSTHEYVLLDKMRVREHVSQRPFDPAWANKIARDFKLERFQTPTVNRVGEWFWIIDGQHSVAALKQWLGEWKGQTVQCHVYRDLSEQQEADMFLWLNHRKNVRAFDKFKAALTAGREEETTINGIVQRRGLKISEQGGTGSISCVTKLIQVYRRGPLCIDRALDIANGAFGDDGLDSDILGAVGWLPARYDGELDDKRAIRLLSAHRGGVNSVRSRGERLHQQTGTQREQCMSAALVEIINRGKGGKKLTSWWKTEE